MSVNPLSLPNTHTPAEVNSPSQKPLITDLATKALNSNDLTPEEKNDPLQVIFL